MKPIIIDRTNTFTPEPEASSGDRAYFWNDLHGPVTFGVFEGYGEWKASKCNDGNEYNTHSSGPPDWLEGAFERHGKRLSFVHQIGTAPGLNFVPGTLAGLKTPKDSPHDFAGIEVLAREWYEGMDLFVAYRWNATKNAMDKECALFFLGYVNDGWV